jgi:hypothetical protein
MRFLSVLGVAETYQGNVFGPGESFVSASRRGQFGNLRSEISAVIDYSMRLQLHPGFFLLTARFGVRGFPGGA